MCLISKCAATLLPEAMQHSGLASRSQRSEILWLVTGSEVSKWGIPPLPHTAGGVGGPCPLCSPRSENLPTPHFHACVALCRKQDRSRLPSPDYLEREVSIQ